MTAPAPRVVLVGTSGYGRRHLVNLVDWHVAGDIELVGLVDVSFDDAVLAMMHEHGIRPDYSRSLDSILHSQNPDTVVVATPPHTHFALAELVLRSGAALYLEKPPVPLLQQLDALERAAGSSRFEIGFQESGFIVDSLEAVIRSGDVGTVTRITAHGALARADSYYQRNSWAGTWFRHGQPVLDGPLFNPLAHVVHTALVLARRIDREWLPTTVTAEFVSLREIEGDDIAAIRIDSNRGPQVVAVGTTASDVVEEPAVTLHGTEGSITIRHSDGHGVLTRDGQNEPVTPIERRPGALFTAVTDPKGRSDEFIDVRAVRPFVTVVNASVQAARAPKSAAHLQHIERRDGETFRSLTGIGEAITAVVQSGRLFSEIGYGWAAPAATIGLRDYVGLRHPKFIEEFSSADSGARDEVRGKS